MLYVIMRYIRTILPICLHLVLTEKKQKKIPINNRQKDSNKTTGNLDNFRLTQL